MNRQLIAAALMIQIASIPALAQESWAVKKGLYKTTKDEKKTETTTAAPAAPEDPQTAPVTAPVLEVQTPVDPDNDPTRPCYPECRVRDAKSGSSPVQPVYLKPVYMDRHALSRRMQITGGIGMLVGIAMALPHGDTVTVLNDDFCVTEYRVDYGSCASNQFTQTKVGLMAIGIGAVILAIGSIPVTRRVAITPTASSVNKSIGAVATVKWGSK